MKCDCCSIIEKKANMLFEDDDVFAMLSPWPAVSGHVVVLPKKHVPIVELLPDTVVSKLFVIGKKFASKFSGDGFNLLIQNGDVAGQSKSHVMLNVVPRVKDDGLKLSWDGKPASEESLSSVLEKLSVKPEPVVEKSAPVEDDVRIKRLRRIP